MMGWLHQFTMNLAPKIQESVIDRLGGTTQRHHTENSSYSLFQLRSILYHTQLVSNLRWH